MTVCLSIRSSKKIRPLEVILNFYFSFFFFRIKSTRSEVKKCTLRWSCNQTSPGSWDSEPRPRPHCFFFLAAITDIRFIIDVWKSRPHPRSFTSRSCMAGSGCNGSRHFWFFIKIMYPSPWITWLFLQILIVMRLQKYCNPNAVWQLQQNSFEIFATFEISDVL